VATEAEALDPRKRPNADGPIGSAVLTRQRRICRPPRRHLEGLVLPPSRNCSRDRAHRLGRCPVDTGRAVGDGKSRPIARRALGGWRTSLPPDVALYGKRRPSRIRCGAAVRRTPDSRHVSLSSITDLDTLEKTLLNAPIRDTNGNKLRAARQLGISRMQLCTRAPEARIREHVIRAVPAPRRFKLPQFVLVFSTDRSRLVSREAFSQESLQNLPRAILRQIGVREFDVTRHLVVRERTTSERDEILGADRLSDRSTTQAATSSPHLLSGMPNTALNRQSSMHSA
jgi:regulatory Fis family protein